MRLSRQLGGAFALGSILLFSPAARGQLPGKVGYRFVSEGGQPLENLLSNSIIDLVPNGSDVLMGTGNGLSVWHTTDSTWSSYNESFGLGHGSVSALGVKNGVIWAATAYTASTSVGYLPAGGGVGFTVDGGLNWIWYEQPVDPDTVETYDPTTTNIQNVTYDLLITSTEVWIASWGGGLRKFSFEDSAWHLVPPDTFSFSALYNLNHRAFSVVGDDEVLWVGTAAGINKSTDGGQTWQNYQYGNADISGNFVTALGRQQWSGHDVLWAATWPAEGGGEYYGVSKTENGGLTWEVALTDENQTLKAHNFAFDDSIVYVSTNLGLYKSVDGGQYWEVLPQIRDFQTGRPIYDPEVYCALAHLGTLWVGTADGVAASNDYGNSWSVLRAYAQTVDTYACPNPFSPRLSPFVATFVYNMPQDGRVTLKVYDFALQPVATIVENAQRIQGQNNLDVWDGLRDDGVPVATGVYYFSVERGGASTVWGKVAVIY